MADPLLNGGIPVNIPVSTEDDPDHDSTYGGGDQSLTTSLESSIWDYHYENGRRYNAFHKGTYWGPNDEPAADQMDINHHIYLITLDGALHLAPIPAFPNRILDLGTGTGIWAIDMGDRYPSASVIGNDLSPIQPSYVPPNVQFEVDDFCDTWAYTASTFDMIHARQLFGCVLDYPKLYSEVMRALKPGGWYEQIEVDVIAQSEDGSIADTALEEWGPLTVEAGKRYGKSMRLLNTMRDAMIDAGFEEVKEVRFKWPIGGWAKDKKMKEIGKYNGAAWDRGMDGWVMYLFTKYLSWTAEEVHLLCARIRQAIRDRRVHAYQDIVFCYGRKPQAWPQPEDPAAAAFTPAADVASAPVADVAYAPAADITSASAAHVASAPVVYVAPTE